MDYRVLNAKKVYAICNNDRRMRASAIAFLLCSSSMALFEGMDSFLWFFAHLLGLLMICNLIGGTRQYMFTCQACALGSVCGLAISVLLRHGWGSPKLQMFCLYTYVFSIFHFSEFFVTGLTNIDSLRADSFLLNHSPEYWMAASSSWLEFAIEAYLFPLFYNRKLSLIGLGMVITGEILRKLAMCHASTSFTHKVAVRKQKNHVLVTRGVYGLCRHPGYLGWFLWSIGTQIILCNPICVCLYARVTFKFFRERIHEEERFLIEFFGQRYISYQQRVPSGILGIKGFQQRVE